MQKERVARQKQTAAVIAEIRKKMADYGLTAADLGSAVKKPGTRKAVAVKYRNAATGESWSGRGRPPHWLADELAKGRKREEFLVG
ncbi:MAG: H-NS histone family protein [Rhodocyclales bacterium]|nr:H-NS histone family protein [Rhodocyclales bacterium]